MHAAIVAAETKMIHGTCRQLLIRIGLKSQIPKSKSQANLKTQIPKSKMRLFAQLGIWSLGFGISHVSECGAFHSAAPASIHRRRAGFGFRGRRRKSAGDRRALRHRAGRHKRSWARITA